MKRYAWNDDKNQQLKLERNISFEDVLLHIEQGGLLAVVEHPNQVRYRGQRLLIVNMFDYAWIVPFVETEHEVFLKTIIPSRKATKQYLRGVHED